LSSAGIDGCFYWYENGWHYIHQWEHFKKLKSAAKLPVELIDDLPDYEKTELPASDRILSRAVCMLIKLSWTPEELAKRVEKMVEVIKQTL
jgi:8-amino-3,8-dideoxy-alpha-D-manno-octulosonate transaminase